MKTRLGKVAWLLSLSVSIFSLSLDSAEYSPPEVDLSLHDVPLNLIFFDDFTGRFIPLSEIGSEKRTQLRDAIPPIFKPRYVDEAEADWLSPRDSVIIYRAADRAYAYPLKILEFHELVHDELDEIPILVSYCPLCGSGIVFDRRIKGTTLWFGNTSALYENNMVMYDHNSGSYWVQVAGKSVVGRLNGMQLDILPSFITHWGDWRENGIPTQVLAIDQGLGKGFPYQSRGYHEQDMPAPKNLPAPLSRGNLDRSIPANSIMLSAQNGGEERAYPLKKVKAGPVNDTLGGERIVVFADRKGSTGGAFISRVEGKDLEFHMVDNQIRDEQTGSVWTIRGMAVNGRLTGKILTPLPVRRAAWFSLSLNLEKISLYNPKKR